jgi:Mitochondrial genome maintenance MGM101
MIFHLFNGFGAARLSFRTVSAIRTYVAVGGRSYTLPRPSPANKTPLTTPLAARVSTTRTTAIKGNREIEDGYPTTASETEAEIAIQSEINNINDTPAESIPSSGASGLPPLLDAPPTGSTTDWSRSYHGLSTEPFPPEVAEILQAAIEPLDIEVKPGPSLERMS